MIPEPALSFTLLDSRASPLVWIRVLSLQTATLSELEKFGRFLIAQQADRSPVTFNRIAEELVCLAFDIHTQCLVELHVLNDTNEIREERREILSSAGADGDGALRPLLLPHHRCR